MTRISITILNRFFTLSLSALLLISISLGFVSCRDTTFGEPGDKIGTSDCLIQTWYAAESFKEVSFAPALRIIELKFNVTEAEKETYQTKYDDHHYNETANPGQYTALVNEFDGISITSDQDFNGIPAGGELGEKFWLIAESPYKWLKSGSLVTYDWNNPLPSAPIDENMIRSYLQNKVPYFYPVVVNVSKLKKEDLLLLDNSCVALVAGETPAIKEHKLTITFHEGERVIKNAATVVFNEK